MCFGIASSNAWQNNKSKGHRLISWLAPRLSSLVGEIARSPWSQCKGLCTEDKMAEVGSLSDFIWSASHISLFAMPCCRCSASGKCANCKRVKEGSKCLDCLPGRLGKCLNPVDSTTADESRNPRTVLPEFYVDQERIDVPNGNEWQSDKSKGHLTKLIVVWW